MPFENEEGILPQGEPPRTAREIRKIGKELAIGRALMSDPDVLMLDEPSLGLSPTAVDTVFEALEAVRAAGKAVLVVEQRAEFTIAFCDRTYVLHDGVITLSLKPEDAENVQILTEAYFG